ncbi:MAG: hypothetical protein H8E55_02155 [Pelagibacterales bacterium]|nr:hypothetical protein [Pelagibacterales bacterium]
MINYLQITKWINPNDEIWFQGKYITNREWLIIEKARIEKVFSKKVIICKNETKEESIWREKLK